MKYLKLKVAKLVENEYLIRNDFETFKIFYRFFLFRPVFKPKILLFFFESFIYIIALVFFKLKINLLFSKNFNNKFLIKRIGTGNYPSVVTLSKDTHKKLVIKKKFNNKNIFERELKYFSEYYNNDTAINLPSFIFHKDFTECFFIKAPSLSIEIKHGKYSKKQIFNIFEKISFSLNILYGSKNKCLIHGDLTPDNIYLISGKVYFIDYSDSEIYFKNFDKFTLLNKMLKDYGENKKKILNCLDKYSLNEPEFWKHLKSKKIIKHHKL